MAFITHVWRGLADNNMTGRSTNSLAAILVCGLMTTLFLMTAKAQDRLERAGYFEVRSASTTLIDGVHELESRLQLVLSDEALDALNSGSVHGGNNQDGQDIGQFNGHQSPLLRCSEQIRFQSTPSGVE